MAFEVEECDVRVRRLGLFRGLLGGLRAEACFYFLEDVGGFGGWGTLFEGHGIFLYLWSCERLLRSSLEFGPWADMAKAQSRKAICIIANNAIDPLFLFFYRGETAFVVLEHGLSGGMSSQ